MNQSQVESLIKELEALKVQVGYALRNLNEILAEVKTEHYIRKSTKI